MGWASSRAVVVLLTVVVALAACGEKPGGGSPGDDVVGEWVLLAGTAGGTALAMPPGSHATLTLDGAQADGTSFCNHYSTGYRISGATIEFDGLGGTEMGCEPAVMTAETDYLTALGAVDTVALEGEDLLLTGDGVELRFQPVPPVPTSELTGTEWVLDTLLDGETAASTVGRSLLRLDAEGTVAATTACHALSGTWTTDEDRVVFADLDAQELDCPEEFRAQDEHEVAVLSDGFQVTVEENRLTALDPDGRGLVYRDEGTR